MTYTDIYYLLATIYHLPALLHIPHSTIRFHDTSFILASMQVVLWFPWPRDLQEDKSMMRLVDRAEWEGFYLSCDK